MDHAIAIIVLNVTTLAYHLALVAIDFAMWAIKNYLFFWIPLAAICMFAVWVINKWNKSDFGKNFKSGRPLKIIGGWSAAIAIALGISYWSERPKYHFEQVASRVGQQLPGAWLISSMKTGDLSSPVSWFWPATTTWNFAVPDRMRDRFYIISMRYGEGQATTFLIDADCEAHKVVWYDLDEPESAYPARDFLGDPVVAPNGQTYRRDSAQLPAPPEWLHAFCETDWTAERKAAASAPLD